METPFCIIEKTEGMESGSGDVYAGGDLCMKKYGLAYSFLFLVLIILQKTKGISSSSIFVSYDYTITFDGQNVTCYLLVYNIAIMAICLLGAIVLTIRKGNKIKWKWLIPVIMLFYLIFLPITKTERINRFEPQDVEIYYESYYESYICKPLIGL